MTTVQCFAAAFSTQQYQQQKNANGNAKIKLQMAIGEFWEWGMKKQQMANASVDI